MVCLILQIKVSIAPPSCLKQLYLCVSACSGHCRKVNVSFEAVRGGDLSSAPSCGEKQYSTDFIDIPFIKAAADSASENNPSTPRLSEGRGPSVKLIDLVQEIVHVVSRAKKFVRFAAIQSYTFPLRMNT